MVLPLRRDSLSERARLNLAKAATLVTGLLSIVFALAIESILDILLYAYNFWAPVILPPLVAAFFGVQAGSGLFLASAAVGLACTLVWNTLLGGPAGIDGLIVGVFGNAAGLPGRLAPGLGAKGSLVRGPAVFCYTPAMNDATQPWREMPAGQIPSSLEPGALFYRHFDPGLRLADLGCGRGGTLARLCRAGLRPSHRPGPEPHGFGRGAYIPK